jgi:signal transduction histidine kinase
LPDENLSVIGDSDRLTQVIVNLLSNAVKFAHTEGGVIGVTLTHSAGIVIIRVQDNGKGIPDNKKEMVFERFTQIDDPNQGKPTGSGLGLFITKRIIEYHNGRIYVDTNQRIGAMFVIELPIEY